MVEIGIKYVSFGRRTNVFLWITSVGKAREHVFYPHFIHSLPILSTAHNKKIYPQPVKYSQPFNATLLHHYIIPLRCIITPSRHVTVQPSNTVNNIIYQYIYIFGLSGKDGVMRCLLYQYVIPVTVSYTVIIFPIQQKIIHTAHTPQERSCQYFYMY